MKSRGFTLLEVMVALAVLAIALAAAIKGVSTNVDNMGYLRDRSLAHWVAMNKVAEIQVRGDWPTPAKTEGATLMGEREWHWKVKVIETPDPEVRRMEVEVRAKREDRQPITKLMSYLGNPHNEK